MNSLKQDKSLLIGSKKDIEELADKSCAKILVLSDSHGVSSILEDIVRDCGKDCDALAFCGDGVCDLAYLVERATYEKKLALALPPVIAFVQGNCDLRAFRFNTQMFDTPFTQTFTACGKNIFLTHGHRLNVNDGFNILTDEALKHKCQIALFGHTHIAWSLFTSEALLLNPGSCARPRGGQPMTFAELTVFKDKPYSQCSFFEYSFTDGIKGYFPQNNFY